MSKTKYLLRRLAAFIIDFIIVFFLGSFLYLFLGNNNNGEPNVLFNIGAFQVFTHPAGFLMGWLYFAVFESLETYQATLGKVIFKLKVCDDNGNRIYFGRASARFFFKIFSIILCIISIFLILISKNRKSLHDYICFTRVISQY